MQGDWAGEGREFYAWWCCNAGKIRRMYYTRAQRTAILQGTPVATLRSNEAPHTGYAALRQWATQLFEQVWLGVAHSPEIGSVVLNAQSVRDSLAHGMNTYKAAAFAAVKDVVEHGAVVAVASRNPYARSYFLAAPVSIADKAGVVVVIVNKDANAQRMYLHSVNTKENLLTLIDSEAHGAVAPTWQNSLSQSGDMGILDITVAHGKLPMKTVALELAQLLVHRS